MKLGSIIVIYTYYGKFPWYFAYFLESCRHNPSVQFLIVTDNKCNLNFPSNVRMLFLTLDEINSISSDKLGFKVEILDPYKLCDFKPAYGFIFSEYIEDYEFWGHGDIDVIFGNIRNFINNDLLKNNDLICLRHDFITGYFTLFRNEKKMNELFMRSKDYKTVLADPNHMCFDETNFKWEDFSEGLSYKTIQSEIESMTHVVFKAIENKYISAHFDLLVIEGTPGRLKWEKGILTFRNEFEILLYHLIRLKQIYNPHFAPTKIPPRFRISPTRIYF